MKNLIYKNFIYIKKYLKIIYIYIIYTSNIVYNGLYIMKVIYELTIVVQW